MSNYPLSISNYQLPEGYKQTEVGVIPEDWGVKAIGDIADVKTGPFGSALHESDYVLDGTPIITVEHLGELGVEHFNLPMVSDKDRNRLKTYSLRVGDIVFSRVGSIDRNALIREIEDGWLFSGRLLRVRIKSPKDYPHYLTYYFHSEPFKQRVREVAVGQTMPSLNTRLLKGVQVVLPTSEEQRAIAATLSDVDALIASIDKLIAKQRHLKTATMQQLLTGKKRLPGFGEGRGYQQTEVGVIPEDWHVVTIREITSLVTNGFVGKATDHYTDKDNGVIYVQGYNVEANAFNFNGIKKVTPEFHKAHQKSCLKRDDLLTVQTGEVGLTTIVPENLEGANCHALIISRFKKDKAYPWFYAHYFNSPLGRLRLKDLEVGTTMMHINVGELLPWQVPYPPQVLEQRAIATVLSDMDAAISALETRRAKTQAIKQGMMQQLLTGRVRLTIDSASQ